LINYQPGATVNNDSYDIRKLPGIVTISAYGADSVMLDASVRPPVTSSDTIRLNVSAAAGSYLLKFTTAPAINDYVWLFDTYTATITDLKANPVYPFTITSNLLSLGASRFYVVVSKNATLPVKLIQFTAAANNHKHVELKWTTAQETNALAFEVEHSTDGKNFGVLASVAAKGNSQQLVNYEWMDEHPKPVNYYRIKMIDKDGTAVYSDIQTVTLAYPLNPSFSLYPSPANDVVHVSHSQVISVINIYDMKGTVRLQQYTAEEKELFLNIGKLEPAFYVVELIDETGHICKQLLLKI